MARLLVMLLKIDGYSLKGSNYAILYLSLLFPLKVDPIWKGFDVWEANRKSQQCSFCAYCIKIFTVYANGDGRD